jgi:hypothetical protein
MNVDGCINVIAVTTGVAGFYTNPAHDGREGTIFHNGLKGFKIVAGLCIRKPGLYVLSGRAGAVAGGHKIHVNGPP